MKRTMDLPGTKRFLLGMALLGLLFAVQTRTAPAADETKDLNAELKLPKAMFVGTPTNVDSPNLDKAAIGKKRTTFLVPKDIKMLSLKTDVTASDNEPIIGEIVMATDGDKEGSDGSFVEMAPGLQWVQIDLKESSEICAAVVWHYHAQARVYHDVVVKCSDDKDFVTGVTTVFNNDHDNSAGLGVGKDKEYIESNEGKLVNFMDKDGKPAKARYIRFYSNGNTANEMNHYIEIEVYGKPAK